MRNIMLTDSNDTYLARSLQAVSRTQFQDTEYSQDLSENIIDLYWSNTATNILSGALDINPYMNSFTMSVSTQTIAMNNGNSQAQNLFRTGNYVYLVDYMTSSKQLYVTSSRDNFNKKYYFDSSGNKLAYEKLNNGELLVSNRYYIYRFTGEPTLTKTWNTPSIGEDRQKSFNHFMTSYQSSSPKLII